jgi:4-hydroxy-tetrahydrodipicolinate synthase
MRRLKGVVTPIITIFKQDGSVDYDAIRTLVETLIAKGVHGLFPNGTTAEAPYLNAEERKAIAQLAVTTAAGRVPVFIHTGGINLFETIEFSRHAVDIGADGIAVVTPSFFGLPQDAIAEYYITIAQALPQDFPIYLYTIPENTGNDILPVTAKLIAEKCPNVVGIKYSGDDMVQILEYVLIREGEFSVMCGNDRAFVPALAGGCDGIVSGLSMVFPKRFRHIYDIWTAGRYEEAMQENRKLVADTVCILSKSPFLPRLKASIDYIGQSGGPMRPPMPQISAQDRAELYQQLGQVDFSKS